MYCTEEYKELNGAYKLCKSLQNDIAFLLNTWEKELGPTFELTFRTQYYPMCRGDTQ
jgi:hypothetical protein